MLVVDRVGGDCLRSPRRQSAARQQLHAAALAGAAVYNRHQD
ncbi:hypothetical protein AABC73_06665 [Pseudomonas sp. G.S.17]